MATEAQRRATVKYQTTKLDTITVRLPKSGKYKERLQKIAEKHGQSVTEYIKNFIDNESEKEGL